MAPLKIECPHLALFHARRNSGKTVLMKHLLGTLARGQKFSWVTVVSATAFNGEWQEVVGEENVLAEFDPEWLEELLARQATLKDNPGLLILDDCLGEADFGSKIFTRIAAAGRHFGVTCWASFQHYHKCPTVLRSNADYVFCLNVQNERVAKSLFEEYGPPGFKDWKVLRDFAAKATRDYGVMVVDNSKGGKISVIRAPAKPKPYKISQ